MPDKPGRVLFVDLARAAAVLFMIQGHALQVLLSPDHTGGPVFNFWLYLRGLTSCAFLLLSGFSFSLATTRHWDDYQASTRRLHRRLGRFAMFLVIGYAMRIPIRPLTDIGRVTASQWQAFAVVDILQVVAVTLLVLQGLAWLARSPRRLGAHALAATAAVVLLTPVVWGAEWNTRLPLFLASYLTSSTGSLFPLFPWAAYIFLGAALGAWFPSMDLRTAGRTLLVGGAAMVIGAAVLNRVPFAPYGPIEFWTVSPNLFLMKAGSVLVLLSLAVRLTRSRSRLPHVVTVLSRESLTVYCVHVCILYGSIWNDGLLQVVGPRLGTFAVAGWIFVLAASMTLLAWLWHECKHRLGSASSVLIRAALTVALVYAIA